jgi:hypothetical protein
MKPTEVTAAPVIREVVEPAPAPPPAAGAPPSAPEAPPPARPPAAEPPPVRRAAPTGPVGLDDLFGFGSGQNEGRMRISRKKADAPSEGAPPPAPPKPGST